MALTNHTIIALQDALTLVSAGNELASAITSGAKLSPDTLTRLQDAMSNKNIGNDLQAAILGTRPLSFIDLQYMIDGFADQVVAGNVASNMAGGISPAAIPLLHNLFSVVPNPITALGTNPPKNVSLPGATTFTVSNLGLPTTVTLGLSAGSTFPSTGPGSSFTLANAGNTNQYMVWYNVAGGSNTNPTPPGFTGIEVTINNTDTNTVVATKTALAIASALAGMTSTVTSNTVTIVINAVLSMVATPTFSPAAGSYYGTQSVSLSSSTAGAAFYYTTDGSIPTTLSPLYSTPISVSANETVNVLATKAGFSNSTVGTAAYVISAPGTVATPTFSPAAGSYSGTQSVTVSSITAGSTFYYTTDGSTPTTGSTLYTGPISVASSETVKVLGVKAGFLNSAIGSAAYTISGAGTVATPTFFPAAGTYGTTQSVTLSSVTAGATFYYTTDGSTPTTGSTLYTGAISVATGETLKVLAIKAGLTNSAVASAAYVIGPTAVNLATAGNYRILSEAGISDTSGSAITGSMAVSPIAHTAITGFVLTLDGGGQFSTAPNVTGDIYAADYAVPTPANLTTAIGDMTTAYNDAAGRTLNSIVNIGSGNLGGLTLTPGLYTWSTGVTIPTTLTLSGGPSDVFIMQISGTLNLAASTHIVLTGGLLASNVFWQVTGAVTLGVSSIFNGIILSATNIAVQTTATVHGRLYAQTAVTLQDNIVGN
jgi:hypothetical protein